MIARRVLAGPERSWISQGYASVMDGSKSHGTITSNLSYPQSSFRTDFSRVLCVGFLTCTLLPDKSRVPKPHSTTTLYLVRACSHIVSSSERAWRYSGTTIVFPPATSLSHGYRIMPRQPGQQPQEPRDFIDLTGEEPQYQSSCGVPSTSQQPAYMAHPGYPTDDMTRQYQPGMMVSGHMHGMHPAQSTAMHYQPSMMYRGNPQCMQPTNNMNTYHNYSLSHSGPMYSTRPQFHSHSQLQQPFMPDPGYHQSPQQSFHAMVPISQNSQTYLPQQKVRNENSYRCHTDGRVASMLERETELPGSRIASAMIRTGGVRAPPGNKRKREHREVFSDFTDEYMVHRHNRASRGMRTRPIPESEGTRAFQTTSIKRRRTADLPASSNEGLLIPDQSGSQTSEAPRSAEPSMRGGANSHTTEICIPVKRSTMATKGPRELSWSSKLNKRNAVSPVEIHGEPQQLSWIETGESATRQLQVEYPVEAVYAMDQGHSAPTPTKAQSETPQPANGLNTFLRDANSDAISKLTTFIIEKNMEKNLANDRSKHTHPPSQQNSSLTQTLLENAEIEPEFIATYHRTRDDFDPLHPDHILNMDNVVFGNDFLDHGPEARQQARNLFEETLESGRDLRKLDVLSRW